MSDILSKDESGKYRYFGSLPVIDEDKVPNLIKKMVAKIIKIGFDVRIISNGSSDHSHIAAGFHYDIYVRVKPAPKGFLGFGSYDSLSNFRKIGEADFHGRFSPIEFQPQDLPVVETFFKVWSNFQL